MIIDAKCNAVYQFKDSRTRAFIIDRYDNSNMYRALLFNLDTQKFQTGSVNLEVLEKGKFLGRIDINLLVNEQ